MKTQLLHAIRSGAQRVRFGRLLASAAILLAFLAQPGTAHATTLSCGSTITTNTTLTANVGPCGNGDAVTFGATGITLNLNGFSIIGPATCGTGSAGVSMGGSDTIKGPGTITAFDQGIFISGNGNTVKHVHLISNCRAGIEMQGSGSNKILNNTLIGNPCLGVFIDNGGSNQIIGNAITGTNAAPGGTGCSASGFGGGSAIEIHIAGGTIVKKNAVNNNTTGMFSDGFSSGVTVSSNDFSCNSLDGVLLFGQATVAANQVNANGQDGITVTEGSAFLVQLNTASNNGRFGIALGVGGSQGSGNNNTTSGNTALGNGTDDLSWDGQGTSNSWTNNICDTKDGVPTVCVM